jgi:hypothetical protein
MNRKLVILLIVGMALTIVALSATFYYDSSHIPANLRSAAALAEQEFLLDARCKANVADAITSAVHCKIVDDPWEKDKLEPGLQQMHKVNRSADSIKSYIDSLIRLTHTLPDGAAWPLASTGLPHHLRNWLDTMFNQIIATAGQYEMERFTENLRKKYPGDFLRDPDWERQNFARNLPNSIIALNLARIKSTVAGAAGDADLLLFEKYRSHCGMGVSPYSAVGITRNEYPLPGEKCETLILPMDINWLKETQRSVTDITVQLTDATIAEVKSDVVNNVGSFTYTALKPGRHTHHGVLTVTGPAGAQQFPFSWTDIVLDELADITRFGDPQFTAGKETRISVKAIGLNQSELQVALDKGSIAGTAGHYVVTPAAPGPFALFVSQFADGKTQSLDTLYYNAK